MTDPNRPSPADLTAGREIDRRRFLKTTAAGGLWLSAGLAGLTGCADEELNPDNRNLIWIAQSSTGRVTTGIAATPVVGASVILRASLDPDFLLEYARGTTDTSGNYRLSAARAGAPDAFWVLEPPEDRRYTVFVQLQASKSGVGGTVTNIDFFRMPQREAPSGNLAPYQLLMNAVIPIQG